jgi:tRNA/rRNA methyltransferase
MTSVLLDALRASGYLNPQSAPLTDAKVRRLVRRLRLQAQDAEVWLGMLRQIVWKLRSEK